MDSAAAERLAKEIIGHPISGWICDSVINHGKSAVVLHARNGAAEAALKVFDRELVERLGRESQIERISRELSLKGRTHPHLIQILDGGFSDKLDVAYVAMEYLPYPNLAHVLHMVQRDRIWPIISQVASAAKFLESLGLCHRDIKPDNIAISDDFQRAILLDLGVLKPRTHAGEKSITDLEQLSFIGTLQYSSPEYLFRQEKNDADGWRALTFYQLGAVLHDLIMQKRLFAESTDPYARLVEAVRLNRPIVEAPDVPARLIQLTKSCLLKEPELRLKYVSWAAFDEAAEVDASTELKQAIRRRIGNAAADHPRADHERRSTIHAMQALQGQLGDLLRHERATSDIFPPMETDEELSDEPEVAHLTITFAASPELLLPRSIRMCFTLTLRDRQSLAVHITVAVALIAPGDHLAETDKSAHSIEFFDGVFENAIVAKQLSTTLLMVINEAQELECVATPKWLTRFDV